MSLQFNRRQAIALAVFAPFSLRSARAQTAAAASAAPAAEGFSAWAESFAADWVRLSPESVTYSQYFGGAEQAAFDSQLAPQTVQHRTRALSLAREGLVRLTTFEAGVLTPSQRTEAATLRWSLQSSVASEPFEDHNFAFSQMRGPQVQYISFMSEAHPMRTPADVQAYLARLRQIDQRMDEALARSRAAAAKGLLPPRFILEKARTQVQDFLVPPAAQNLFVEALKNRSASIEGLSATEREATINEATELVEKRIRPAWQRVEAFMNELHPRTTADAGLWRLPGGDKAYAQALATFTTTSLGAEEIHAIGLREVARIEGEMDAVLKSMGRAEGSVKVRMAALNAELQPPASPDPRPGLIEKHKAYVADNIRRSQAFFNLLPKAPVEVRREPPLTEKTAAAHYSMPAPDGSRPGVFWAPLPGPVFEVARMRSLAVHEAVPGHHYQLALQQEQTQLPRWRQRRIFGGGSAHSEGWALYAERLAIDNGWYDGDPAALLGALDSQLFRARRLVVDTGLHAKKWTREQAIDYGIGAQEVERYVAMPGQACAYMIGMLRMLALREDARRVQGAGFDVKAFHDLLLTTGSVPLDVLGDVVQRWTAERLAAGPAKAA
jgi:uncharacterized protein (DUF885 family)